MTLKTSTQTSKLKGWSSFLEQVENSTPHILRELDSLSTMLKVDHQPLPVSNTCEINPL